MIPSTTTFPTSDAPHGVRGAMCAMAQGTASLVGRRLLLALFGVLAATAAVPSMATTSAELTRRGQDIEVHLLGFPKRALTEIRALLQEARAADADSRHFLEALHGQAMVQAGRKDDALQLADQLESEGWAAHDDVLAAIALLIRSSAQSWAGDADRANKLAIEARNLVKSSNSGYVQFWAAMSVGTSARVLGHSDESLSNLQDAFSQADAVQNPYRRAIALYQLSILDLYLKQPDKAFDESVAAYREGKVAGSAYAMAKAKMAEAATLEILNRPQQELAAMQEALAIARNAHSEVTECFALINLADIYLRRRDFKAAHDLSERSLALAQQQDDVGLVAASKANMGFSLFGLGRIDAGKALAEEALAEYERAGASAEIADLLGEYGFYLANAGDFKSALALRDRQQSVVNNIMKTVQEKNVLELQGKFESEKRIREIELLNREKDLQSIEIRNRQFQQRIWWLLAAVFALSFAVVAVLYRKLRTTNHLLAHKNTELSFQSSRDPLTALFNRRHFQNFINETHGEADRRTGAVEQPVQAILLIDLDHFKLINDQFGHAAGDAVLIAVARRLRDTLRETDMIVRWGGEEFLVFVPMAPADRIDEIVSRILHAVSTVPINYMGHYINVTVSIGYSPVLLPPDNIALGWERVLGLVDKALYMAKKNGRNRAYGIGSMRNSGTAAMAAIDADLDQAWQDGIVDLRVVRGTGVPVATAAAAPATGDITRH
jgi:diguanylate cyclase (GGDEF)-like protein